MQATIRVSSKISRVARAQVSMVLRDLLPGAEVVLLDNEQGYRLTGDFRKVDAEVACELAGLEVV